MNYPNGSLNINKLKDMVSSKDYHVYYETKEEKPSNWDFLRFGIKRGARTEIKDVYDLMTYLSKELNNEGTICYEYSDDFFKKHPYCGESMNYVKPTFIWEYQSYKTKICYKIRESTYFDEKPKYPSLDLVVFEKGFESNPIVIGSWKKNQGYEFHSNSSSLFKFIDDEDLTEIWKAIKEADKFLNDRYMNEEKE